MATRMIDGNIEVDNTGYSLHDLVSKGYGTLRFQPFTIDATTTTNTGTIPITTTGRPVFAFCTGDLNPTDTAWVRIIIYRDGVQLRTQIAQGYATGYHNPFSLSVLDYPSEGHHEYSVSFVRGNGTSVFGSGTESQAIFSIFEI